jgi:hypothetical protein
MVTNHIIKINRTFLNVRKITLMIQFNIINKDICPPKTGLDKPEELL